MPATIHRARWIIPIDAPPIENGRLVVSDGRIVSIERSDGPSTLGADYGEAVLLPGFVNAHTHLELTHLAGRVSYRGSFARWVEELVAASRPVPPDEVRNASIHQGIKRSLASGVTAIGDIGMGRHAIQAWAKTGGESGTHSGDFLPGPWMTGYLEVLGMGPRRDVPHERSLEVLSAACDAASSSGRLRLGLSPHAPYSTDASIYRRVIEYAFATGRPLCTHLAETTDELQFLADGTGPLRDLLERWGLWDGSFMPPQCSAVEYANRLGLLKAEALLVHVNYASDKDIELLAGHEAHVALCPRSHRFFGHRPHRFRDMLRRGINVCIGTDSLASNDSLSVLDELRFLYAEDRSIPSHVLLHMGTLAGARALGLGATCGSLTVGKSADFVVLPTASPPTRNVADDILSTDARPLAVLIGGRSVGRQYIEG